MRRPPTERERLATRLNIAAHEALRVLGVPDGIRGFSPMPCPGSNAFHHPCKATGAWVGTWRCGAGHRWHHTNHPHDSQS